MYVCMYIYICVLTHTCTCIYIHLCVSLIPAYVYPNVYTHNPARMLLSNKRFVCLPVSMSLCRVCMQHYKLKSTENSRSFEKYPNPP